MLKVDLAAIDTKIEQLRSDLEFWENARDMFSDPRIADAPTVSPLAETLRMVRVQRDDLPESVKRVMESEPSTEWTSRTLLTRLQQEGAKVPEKDDAAMNAVSLALYSLVESGEITRIHEGRGRDPHRYMAKEFKDQELAEASSQNDKLQF